MRKTYRVGDVRVGIRSTSEAFGEWLDYALSGYLVDHEADPRYSIVLPAPGGARGGKLSILYKGAIPLVRTFDPRILGRALLEELESLSFGKRDDAIYVRAGILRSGPRTALVPTALVHHLARLRGQLRRAGASLSPGQAVAIDPGSARVVPIKPSLGVPRDALDRLGGLTTRDEEDGGERLFVDEPLDVDVVCGLADLEAPLIEPMSRGTALHHLSGEVANLQAMGGRALLGLRTVVERARCYGLGGDDARAMIDAMTAVLRDDTAAAARWPQSRRTAHGPVG